MTDSTDGPQDQPPDEPAECGADAVTMRSGLRRWLYLGAGFVLLGVAAIGVIVPLLPTTPLVILAAACFARSSPRMHQRLLDNRVFGPLIVDWNEHRAIPMRAKVLAVTMITVFGTVAIVLVDPAWAKIALGALFLSVITWLLTRPSPPAA